MVLAITPDWELECHLPEVDASPGPDFEESPQAGGPFVWQVLVTVPALCLCGPCDCLQDPSVCTLLCRVVLPVAMLDRHCTFQISVTPSANSLSDGALF